MRDGWRYALAGLAGSALGSALLATVRFRHEAGEEPGRAMPGRRPVLYALWHGRLLPLTYFHRNRGIAAMISRSKDGEYIARIARAWGFDPVRGSTSRGGSGALREIARRIGAGQSVAVTPDGPRGPREKVQPGVVAAARLTGAPILPVAAACTRAWWPEGWDRFCVPKPFSTVFVAYGEPRYVPRDADRAELDRHAAELEEALNALLEMVDRRAGGDGRSRLP
jgi:lysophospholipid acyltransferase (LPLAT)-like uncharacterized protein